MLAQCDCCPKALRHRAHYHCDEPGSAFDTERPGRIRNHQGKHTSQTNRAPSFSEKITAVASEGYRHFHSRYCAKVFVRDERIHAHESTHGRNYRISDAPARLYGMPSAIRPAHWFSNILLRRDIFQYTSHRPTEDMIRGALWIREQCAIPGDARNFPIWRKVFKVQDFQTDMRAFPH